MQSSYVVNNLQALWRDDPPDVSPSELELLSHSDLSSRWVYYW